MANITITINTDNAAFEGESWGLEVARILRDLAAYLPDSEAEVGPGAGTLRDHNGNTVGSWEVSEC